MLIRSRRRTWFASIAVAGVAGAAVAAAIFFFPGAGDSRPVAATAEPSSEAATTSGAAPGSEQVAARAGTVTMADRVAAIDALAACMREAELQGVEVRHGEGLRRGGVTFQVKEAEDIAAADALYRGCIERTTSPVERAWAKQQGVLTADETEALHRRLEACVAAGGVPDEQLVGGSFGYYPNPPLRHIQIARADLDKFHQCAQREEETTGLKPPFPIPGTIDEVHAWMMNSEGR